MHTTLVLTIATTALIGPLAGMSLDQSIKQLPARRQIGVLAYSTYSRAGDLGPGLFLYPPFGLGAALFAVAAAVSGHLSGLGGLVQALLDLSAVLAILHTIATARAAPINLGQRNVDVTDAAKLSRLFDRFERWHNVRAALQVMNFGIALWATVLLGGT